MKNAKFKKTFELTRQLEEKKEREDYERLSKVEKNIGTFDEDKKEQEIDVNREISDERKTEIQNAYISRDE